MRRRVMAMMGGGGKPTARDYVQRGLVAMWDGIENTGYLLDGYQHDNSARTWIDLVGGVVLSLGDYASFTDNSAVNTDTRYAMTSIADGFLGIHSFEIGYKSNNGTDTVLLNIGNGIYAFQNNNGVIWCNGTNKGGGISRHQSITTVAKTSYHNLSFVTANNSNEVVNAYDKTADITSLGTSDYWQCGGVFSIGGNYASGEVLGYALNGYVNYVRLYNEILTPSEIAANYAVDKARFNLP